MEENEEGNGSYAEKDYPHFLASNEWVEENEEENPLAYTLLSKIEDPYYAKDGKQKDPSQKRKEEEKNNLSAYETFYTKSSQRQRLGEAPTTKKMSNGMENIVSAKPFIPRKYQEPKRHASEKVFSRDEQYKALSYPISRTPDKFYLESESIESPPLPSPSFFSNNLPMSAGASTPPPPGIQYNFYPPQYEVQNPYVQPL